MSVPAVSPVRFLAPGKFRDPRVTARGEARAQVALRTLDTLWFNTGTLCNLACDGCYIESSPSNDRLSWLTLHDVLSYLDEIEAQRLPTRLIGFTGGEPFMNPELMPMLDAVLERGHDALVLTNAMKPMAKCRVGLLSLQQRHGQKLALRVSLDHYGQAVHEAARGARSWAPTLDGLQWLARHGFVLNVASRMLTGETQAELRAGFAQLFARLDLPVDAHDPVTLMLFPEMDASIDVPEITTACWGILSKSPDEVMCASSRMVVRRKGAQPSVVACTLLPYDPQFDLGASLFDAAKPVALNHPHCARFCVLGGAACSR